MACVGWRWLMGFESGNMNLKQMVKDAREYVEIEAETKVKRVTFAERFSLFGREDVVLSVTTTDKEEPEWWVVGGSTPMNLYAKSVFRSADEAFSMHAGIMLRMADADFARSEIGAEYIGYDAFISHAFEDKKALVRPLADALGKMGYRIWYDEFELEVGDSLRQSIDRGLANSRYGIVILSPAFFAKHWTQYELNGLNAREMEGRKVILPVWYKITKSQILKVSPALADKVAARVEGHAIRKVAIQLARVLDQ
jgi:hypothetical protein